MQSTVQHTQSNTSQLGLAAMYAKDRAKLRGGLYRKGVNLMHLDDALQDVFVAAMEDEAAGKYDGSRSAPKTYVGHLKLRSVAKAHRSEQIQRQTRELRAENLYKDSGDREDAIAAFGLSALAADQEFSLAFKFFLAALQRSLTKTEASVFSAAGGLTALTLDQFDRAALADQLEMSDCALRKMLHNLRRKFRALWSDHFDAPLPE